MTVASIATASHGFCFDEAAARYRVNEQVLRAIAFHESKLDPSIMVSNSNGSTDIGLMGINTIHLGRGEPLGRGGFTTKTLLQPCSNVMAGAFLLRKKMDQYGNTWQAVGAYHSTTEVYNQAYQAKIKIALESGRKR